tara:strand:- start:438 stop:743 length:306 start_codon:yes stop_codon:yes gene_type:complete
MKYYKQEVEQLKGRTLEAFTNSYRVIIEEACPYSIIEKQGNVVFAHNVDAKLEIKNLNTMISFWEELEEYEKCAKLKKFQDEIKRLSRENMRSSDWLSQIP